MTAKQKDIIRKLLNGHNIVGNSTYGFRLRDEKQNVVLSFNRKTYFRIKGLLRKQKDFLVINRNKVRQLHGKCFAKQLYKKQARKGDACEPCSYQSPGRSIVAKPIKKKPSAITDEIKSQLQIF